MTIPAYIKCYYSRKFVTEIVISSRSGNTAFSSRRFYVEGAFFYRGGLPPEVKKRVFFTEGGLPPRGKKCSIEI